MASPPRSLSGDELDELTLRRAQRGDDDACRALVEQYQRAVFALLSRTMGPSYADEVEDIAQETFLDVFRALEKFSVLGSARLSTWILTIASRRAIDKLRKARPVTESVGAVDALIAPERTDASAHRRAIAAAIRAAVDALAPEYRAAFVLREYHHLDYADIAKALGIDLGTVKSRLSRARQRLRDRLAELHHD